MNAPMRRLLTSLIAIGWALTLLSCSKVSSPSAAGGQGGVDIGNGGDAQVSEFIGMAREIVELLESDPIPGIDALALKKAVDTTVVESKETLVQAGIELSALNFPDALPPRIVLNRTAWLKLFGARHEKQVLVLHEYLGILRVPDRSYELSRELDRARVCGRTTQVREWIERELRLSCDRIQKEQLRFLTKASLRASKIENLKPGDFRHLIGLKKLDLSKNRIRQLGAGYFADLVELDSLDLSGNDLRVLPTGAFEGLRSVSMLDLRANLLREIQAGAFSGATAIRRLVGAQRDTWQNLSIFLDGEVTTLGKAVLRGTQVSTVAFCSEPFFGAFDPVGRAFPLESPASLTSIHPEAFAEAPHLINLELCIDLTRTKTPFPVNLIAGAPQLKTLTLKGFGLREIPVDFFRLRQLTTLKLSGPAELTLPQLSMLSEEGPDHIEFEAPRTTTNWWEETWLGELEYIAKLLRGYSCEREQSGVYTSHERSRIHCKRFRAYRG